jgi:predicted nucleotidyltransferase component of viral defense system
MALASEDNLMQRLVLKGGNAIDLAYNRSGNTSRTSFDLDYSIEGDDDDIEDLKTTIENVLSQTFIEKGYIINEFKFESKPHTIKDPIVASFWGGHKIGFKVIKESLHEKYKGDKKAISRNSIALKDNSSTVFDIEISKYEYTGHKQITDIDELKLYVYSREMIVFEKLRALCQQMPMYSSIVPDFSPRSRARDFYDIFYILDGYNIDMESEENKTILKHVFDAKKVPLDYIKELRNHKSIHADNWNSVTNTVSNTTKIEDFDFYFNFVLDKFENIIFP